MNKNPISNKKDLTKLLRDTPPDKISVYSPATKTAIKEAGREATLARSKTSALTIVLIRQD